MAEGDITVYNDLKEQLFKKVHDFVNDTIKLTLHTGYTPNIDTHQVRADVSGTEYTTAAGYTAGGVTLANKSVTQDNTNDRALFDADDAAFASLGPLSPATPSHAIIWNDTPSSPADPVVANIELGTTATNGGNYTIQFSTSPSAILSIT
jgi:hypothetical protein